MKKKIAAWVSSATTFLALFTFWPRLEPALNWFVHTSGLILIRPQVQAVIASITIGVLLAGFMPYLEILQNRPRNVTKAITRFVCFVVTFTCAYLLAPHDGPIDQRTALIYALLAALASAQVWTTLAGILYRFKAKPESLK